MCQQAKAERIWQGDVQGQQLEEGGILISARALPLPLASHERWSILPSELGSAFG